MPWHARLDLDYSLESARTVARFRHSGPLRILQSLYPEGDAICHNVLVHPPGGLVGGDTLEIAIGPEGRVNVRTAGSPDTSTLVFLASATVTHGGGGNDDPSAWNVEMNVSGAKTNSATTAKPGAVTSVVGTPLTDSASVTWTDGTGSPYGYEASLESLARNSDFLMVATSGGGASPVRPRWASVLRMAR